MEHRAEARIDVAAITANISLLKDLSGVDLLAVVKADAYGHGLIEIGLAAQKSGADWLGVALLEEAIALRTHGVQIPILAWLLPPGSDFRAAHNHNIDIAVASIAAFNELSSMKSQARIHIEVDTGMTRGGFLDEWQEFLTLDFSHVEVVGIFSHFARADEPNEKQNPDQLNRFNAMVADLAAIGINPPIKHISNSAATMKNHDATFDLVRTGIAMYGLSPDVKTLGDSKALGLKPAMQLRAKLHLVKKVPAGSLVGYGATAVTKADTTLGVVAMGYADGIPRTAQAAGVFFDGTRAPIIGRVSMDQFMVDLGPDSTAISGDWTIVFGDGSRGEYTADDWGAASSSINYEIITRIGPRVPRIYAPHVY
ncbi:MAG: alanine racemase [Candidatus Planktophila sp.]|nr:alanine racemase [Candidatus Planktophila sp.]PHX69523.1 MAG: alanine racemase [Actinomycetota bacterium]